MGRRTSKTAGTLISFAGRPWTHFVGTRYLRSKKSSRFLSFITLLSITGIGIGVTAMIVVLSVMDGFEEELKKRLMSADMHVLITPTPEAPTASGGFVLESSLASSPMTGFLETDPRIDRAWPVVSTEAILRSGTKIKGVVLKGINAERLEELSSQLTESAEPAMLSERSEGGESVKHAGAFIGQELAYEMGLIPGDFLTLISPTETEGPLAVIPRMKRFVVEGVYHSGLPDQELYVVFTRQAAVRSFLRKRDVLSQWEISLKRFDDAFDVAQELRPLAPGFKVQDWGELNSHLFASLKLERFGMFILLAFIIVVASFNIVSTLTLMVLEKKREISILRAMGATRGDVGAIFMWEGILIGICGVFGGALLGAVLCGVLRRYEFITLPDIYYDRTLPVTFSPLYYLAVSVAALGIVLLACLYPSRRAARLNPLDGIRNG